MIHTLISLQAIDKLDLGTVFDMQDMCMERFITIHEPEEERGYYEAMDPQFEMRRETPCDWQGIYCVDELVSGIQWFAEEPIEIHSLDWIPPTTRNVDIMQMKTDLPLHAERLPRGLKFLRIQDCSLMGTLDVEALPKTIEEVHLAANHIDGCIDLVSMPQSLKILDLSSNEITKLVWRKSKLPAQLQAAYIFGNSLLQVVHAGAKKANDERLHLQFVERLPAGAPEYRRGSRRG